MKDRYICYRTSWTYILHHRDPTAGWYDVYEWDVFKFDWVYLKTYVSSDKTPGLNQALRYSSKRDTQIQKMFDAHASVFFEPAIPIKWPFIPVDIKP